MSPLHVKAVVGSIQGYMCPWFNPIMGIGLIQPWMAAYGRNPNPRGRAKNDVTTHHECESFRYSVHSAVSRKMRSKNTEWARESCRIPSVCEYVVRTRRRTLRVIGCYRSCLPARNVNYLQNTPEKP